MVILSSQLEDFHKLLLDAFSEFMFYYFAHIYSQSNFNSISLTKWFQINLD